MLRDSFQRVLDEYGSAKKSNLAGNPLADLMRRHLPTEVRSAASIGPQYLVAGSPGLGNWAEVPWVAVFDRAITEGAERGYYVVYLFNAQMKGVYLSLNQGWTQYQERYGTKLGRERIRETATKFQRILKSPLGDFSFDSIVLDAPHTLGLGYELGHICGTYYESGRLPEDFRLVSDLQDLRGVYRELKGLVGIDVFSAVGITLAHETEEVEEAYQRETNEVIPKSPPPGPLPKPQKTVTSRSEAYRRNPSRGRFALSNAKYGCEVNPQHHTFRLRGTGNQYVEAHHLVPMEFQDEFQFDLDVPENIVSLCPVCHRLLHKAIDPERRPRLEMLFKNRAEALKTRGIVARLDDLLRYYSVLK